MTDPTRSPWAAPLNLLLVSAAVLMPLVVVSTLVRGVLMGWVPPGGMLPSAAMLLALVLGMVWAARRLQQIGRKLADSEAKARELAYRDPVTGLPNRRAFLESMNRVLDDPLARGALICVDLDDFKELNQVFGREAGDLLLVEMARRLRGCLPPSAMLARLADDEFAVWLRGSVAPADMLQAAQRLGLRTQGTCKVHHVDMQISACLGVAPVRLGVSADELLRQGDMALRAARSEGRSRARLFESAMDEGPRAAKALEADLRAAMDTEQISLVFQPIVYAASQRLCSVEALARWDHPVLGPVPPGRFISVAETTGLIVELGERLLRKACQLAVDWPDLKVSVNLSPVQFRNVHLVRSIRQILSETGFPAQRLELEITESYLLAQPGTAARVIHELRELGIALSLDDFGTGYASIGFLRRFELDRIKLDRSYVVDIARNRHSAEVAEAMVALARTLSLPVTAEGVETEAQAAVLARMGCARLQGWLYGKAMDAESFQRQWLPGRLTPEAPRAEDLLLPPLEAA